MRGEGRGPGLKPGAWVALMPLGPEDGTRRQYQVAQRKWGAKSPNSLPASLPLWVCVSPLSLCVTHHKCPSPTLSGKNYVPDTARASQKKKKVQRCTGLKGRKGQGGAQQRGSHLPQELDSSLGTCWEGAETRMRRSLKLRHACAGARSWKHACAELSFALGSWEKSMVLPAPT